jgi:hypothetical protein
MKANLACRGVPHSFAVLLAAILASTPHVCESAGPESESGADGAASETTPLESQDSWYPRIVESEKGTVVIHGPQIDSWTDFERIGSWVAFEVTRAESEQTYFGSVHLTAATDTDIAAREVLLYDFEIQSLSIKGIAEDSREYRVAHEGISAISRKIPLDLILEYLPQDIPVADDGDFNSEPPQIFVSTSPAILLSVDSEPIFVPVGDASLQFLLNTNWDVLRVGDKGALFLCHQNAWMTAPDLDGPWTWAAALPDELGSVPDDANWTNVAACLAGESDGVRVAGEDAPTVFYTTVPAEMILIDGNPDWAAIGDTGLSYAANTTQELFRVDPHVYFLASGRWFRAADVDGPWVLARELPDAFHQLPPESETESHPKSYIRVSVPGTREAWEAALVASIPRKAEIVRGTEAELDVDVTYAGEPAFAPIETTEIELAVNTSYQVLRFEGTYYLCHNAVWLTGPAPDGPWQYADSIPEAFADIPPSSPAYNTTFVTVGESDEEFVEYAYTSGYEGMYVEDETVVQGTGYASSAVAITVAYGIYDGWWGYPYYPYYPWPPSYGYGSWYDPSTGRYGEAIVGYGPYGAAAGAAVYNPETGVYGRGQAVWDSDEFAGRGFAYNPNTGTSVARNRYIDFDDNEGWSQGVARRGDEWRYRQSEWHDGTMRTEFESSLGTQGEVYREREGDTITSEGTIQGENRSATFESTWEDGQGTASIEGSEGGSGDLDRQVEDGQITGSGEFTKDGKTIESDVTRTAEGVKREFETSEGGQGTSFRSGEDSGFMYESGSGDMYAGRDGNVYQKTEDGWAPVENPGAQAGTGRAQGSASATGLSTSQYSSRTSQLERDYQSRQAGFDRYSRYQSSAGTSSRRGGMRRGRRR